MNNNFALDGLILLAQFHNIPISPEQIKHKYDIYGRGLDLQSWLLAAKELGLKAKVVQKDKVRLPFINLPIMVWDKKTANHFVLAQINYKTNQYLIYDFALDKTILLSESDFEQRYSGEVILVTSRFSTLGSLAKFDFTWFIPAIIKYRRILFEVLLISVALQIFALVSPLFFQVVMDKVLVHQSFSTLNVVAIGLMVVSIFEILLGGIRTFIFSHTTSRIDVELGAKLFRHLLSLPIAYFEVRRVGEIVARIKELEQIRNFLTGQALTAVLDLIFSLLFLIVMWQYSTWLTLVVVISLPLYAIWSAIISPILRHRLNDKFSRNADNHSFLVESVSAMNTIKTMAISPQITEHWDKLLASYVSSSLKVTKLTTLGQQGILLIQKLVAVANLWIGAHLVINNDITIGQLIAFNMLASQVMSPVIRLAQFWQDFQQIGISVSRLGDILNIPTESSKSTIALPQIRGEIEFKQVSFRYRPDGMNILDALSFKIQPSEIIGIVGRSGSGKSTVAKLIQRLYSPLHGRVLIDGQDLALIDPIWLRRQMGIVLQDNILLNRSIRDNITLAEPSISMDKIIAVAKLAGAHEFIINLPEGYDTLVGEQGTNLSGGQKQRIAIARALISDPKILIFDEATSALDYESEHIIMQNMRNICAGRTVIMIAHRLSTIMHADRIIVMDKGKLVEQGNHYSLLELQGIYYHLYQLQSH
ncbi:type I secretion system permease/ATPase [Actinobacillus equuli subsp. equuli]|uniref:Toxin RTX-III translocation ATP-binding protein (RTX-III toxin determinant B) n=1 Tax=Actinobacillus equuli TaxID=718 RepID=A0AAX3FIM6_ACTEU|nr:peptidase C39 [Actinobacillus equuli subsp. equuli]VEE90950.1 toxin RTX-III translocation ATP-binding protein (RTX-III toxin determinant B) [Actinobacillus equuli]